MVKCGEHKVEYQEVEIDYEYHGVILRGVKALRCPVGGEEVFTLEQAAEIKRRISDLIKPLKLKRRISSAGKMPAIYLPEDVTKAVQVKIGDEVEIYTEGRRIIIEPTEKPEEEPEPDEG